MMLTSGIYMRANTIATSHSTHSMQRVSDGQNCSVWSNWEIHKTKQNKILFHLKETEPITVNRCIWLHACFVHFLSSLRGRSRLRWEWWIQGCSDRTAELDLKLLPSVTVVFIRISSVFSVQILCFDIYILHKFNHIQCFMNHFAMFFYMFLTVSIINIVHFNFTNVNCC